MARKQQLAAVRHAELFGLRIDKYKWLSEHDVNDTDWEKIAPETPRYYFASINEKNKNEYYRNTSITNVMQIHSSGFKSHRDHFAVSMVESDAKNRIKHFCDANVNESELRTTYNLDDTSSWNLSNAREQIRKSDLDILSYVCKCLYRPFDFRYCLYSQHVMDRPRKEVLDHLNNGQNVALLATRQTRDKWDVLATEVIPMHKACAAYDTNTVFPLYLYPTGEDLFADSPWPEGACGRRPNLNKEFVDEFAGKVKLKFVSDGKGDLKKTFGPEDVFHYMYAIFHSPTYRDRYAEFLKIDFPRLPLTSDVKLLRKLCGLGEKLVKLHLLEEVPASDVQFPVAGDNEVDKPTYAEKGSDPFSGGRVYINKTQYFDHVLAEVWEFHVGGYQVCQKWLKDRKGRQLNYDDITHYRNIVAALGETITLMSAIDETIPTWPIP